MLRRILASLAAIALTAVVASSAFAYAGTVPANIVVSASGAVVCAEPFTVSATVIGDDGLGMADQTVIWSSSAGKNVTFNPASSKTDATGVATTQVTIKVAGPVTISATVGDAVGAVVVTAKACEAVGGVTGSPGPGGLPNTSTATPADAIPSAGVPLAILALLAGAVLTARRMIASPR